MLEKYQLTFMIDFCRVFRDGANVKRINFRGGDVVFVKNTLFPLYLRRRIICQDMQKILALNNNFSPTYCM
jgi:hypothetical protein